MTRRAWTQHLRVKIGTQTNKPSRRLPKTHVKIGERSLDDSAEGCERHRLQVYLIRAVPKPTMTHVDRWAKRPAVLRYRAYGDLLRWHRASLPEAYLLVACFTPPASLSAKRQAQMIGQVHQRKPDASNLQKAIEDHLMPNADQRIYDGRCIKLWGNLDLVCIIDTRGRRLETGDVSTIAHARTAEEIPVLLARIPADGETCAG